ncbi:MAG: FUSC family protein, partial [Paeniclostridium sordellii]|nr:FUSC family protein [Paeniclostridium sordellii]
FNTNSARFTYAFKVGLGIAIAGFIKDFFHLIEGRWIMFTVFALIQPYSEMCITKSKKRIVGTIVGCFIVFILFSIFKEKSIRGIIIILAGYTSSYTKDYRDLMICNTISAIGAICAFGPPQIFILNRFLFVILGVFIALIINKLILPYNAKNGYKSLINMYKEVISEMSLEIQLCVKDQSNLHKVKNLVLISTLIEDKIISMQDLVKDSNHNNLLRDKKIMMSNMYSLYLKLKSTKDKYDVESVITNPENAITLEKAKDMVIDNINSSNDKDNKIVYKNLLYILENNEDTKSYA